MSALDAKRRFMIDGGALGHFVGTRRLRGCVGRSGLHLEQQHSHNTVHSWLEVATGNSGEGAVGERIFGQV